MAVAGGALLLYPTVHEVWTDHSAAVQVSAARARFFGSPTTVIAVPTVMAAPTSTTQVEPPANTMPPPAPAVSESKAVAEGAIIGWLTVSAIDVDIPIREGLTDAVSDTGAAGRSAGSAQIGDTSGIVTLGAHRTSHGHAFKLLNELQPGAIATVTLPDGAVRTYIFTSWRTMPEAEAASLLVSDPAAPHHLVLLSCSKPSGRPTSSAYRIAAFFSPADPDASGEVGVAGS